jgi:site-specific DNA-methyltransferase (adenine-specific)
VEKTEKPKKKLKKNLNDAKNDDNKNVENMQPCEVEKPKKNKKVKKAVVTDDNETVDNVQPDKAEKTKKVTKDDSNKKYLLFNNDCLIELDNLEDNSIDCVITDPPYFIDKLDDKWSSKEINENVKNSHITHLPKGMKFDKNQITKLYDFYLKVSKILLKKMKPGGYFLSFSSPRLYHAISMACEIAGFEIRDMINWVYTQTMPKGMSVDHIIEKLEISDNEKKKLKKEYKNFKTPMIKSCFEPICVAMKPINMTFILNEISFKTGLIDFSHKVGKELDRVPANIMTTYEFNEIYDKNFLVSKPSKEEKGEYNTHITVKPVNLIEQLMKIFSKEKSLVVDPFMGSGTTGVCCKNLNRKFIGIELNKEYYEISKKRMGIED